MKKLLCLLLAACMLLTLAACGGSAPAEEKPAEAPKAEAPAEKPAEAPKAEPVTLTVLWGQSTTDAGLEDMIDEAMAAKYPHISIEWECVDWGNDFQPKMQQYMQSGLPDIMIGKAQDVATYNALGVLGEIGSEYVDRGVSGAADNVTIDGTTYGMIINALYQGVYYNRAMFAENGWEVPATLDELQAIIDDCNAKGIVPFASHMVDTWSIGNVTMQYMTNDVFNHVADWGDRFRAGEVNFATDEMAQAAYMNNKLVFDNTFPETFSLDQASCDAKLVLGEAAMKVSGSWSIQQFLDIDDTFDFGIFPFPNKTGDSKLIFEPNITVMTYAETDKQEAVDAFLDIITGDKELLTAMMDYTKTASMIDGVTATFANPSQADVDKYAAAGMITDVTLGNTQLIWGGFQEENAADIAAWLQGDITFEQCLAASDARVDASSAG